MLKSLLYRYYVWFLSYIIRPNHGKGYLKKISLKRIRQRFRRHKLFAYMVEKVKKEKWCVSYSVFDGEELLEPSILAIRDEVDHVQVLYQTCSWTGTYENKNLKSFLLKLQEKGLIDELIEFKPDIKDKPWHNELKKRRIGLKAAKKAKCTYFMTMDTDEFYFVNDFKKAKHTICSKGITHSYAVIENYALSPTDKVVYFHSYCVPFFAKIHWFCELGDNKKAPCTCDPTRMMLNYPFAKHRLLNGFAMHHMSRVRNDLKKKIVNSSGYSGKKYKYWDERVRTCPVEDVFNILPYLTKK